MDEVTWDILGNPEMDSELSVLPFLYSEDKT